ncbi:MAG: hypothetical protein M1812_000871 [Candelaria pacifica]|nr:MAG: hypothetical protein M1812_000871 [Candelaria pacifica]
MDCTQSVVETSIGPASTMSTAMQINRSSDAARCYGPDVYMNLGDDKDKSLESYDTDYPFRTVRDRRFGENRGGLGSGPSSIPSVRFMKKPSRPVQRDLLLKNASAIYHRRSGDQRHAREARDPPGSSELRPSHKATEEIVSSLPRNKEKEPSTATSTPRLRLPQPKPWKQQLAAQMKGHQEAKTKAYPLEGTHDQSIVLPYQIRSLELFDDDDVMNGIAAVWHALDPNASTFAFGTAQTIRSAQLGRRAYKDDDRPLIPVAGWPNPFLIPLRCTGEESDQEFTKWAEDALKRRLKPGADLGGLVRKLETLCEEPSALSRYLNDHAFLPEHSAFATNFIRRRSSATAAKDDIAGHYVLVIAERMPAREEFITFTIFNSASSIPVLDTIRRAAKDVVTHSGWLPLGLEPKFGKSQPRPASQQLGKYSGIHVVLNAWAYMLHIPLNTSPEKKMNRTFYNQALQVINLALSGHMDTKTIRTFFNVHGFASQSLDDGENQLLHTIAVYGSTLHDRVENLRQFEREARDSEPDKELPDIAPQADNVDTVKPVSSVPPRVAPVAPVAQMLPSEVLAGRKVTFDLPPERPISETTPPRLTQKVRAERPGNMLSFGAEQNRNVLDRQRAIMESRFPDTPESSPTRESHKTRQPRPHRIHAETLLDEDDMHLAITALSQGIAIQRGSPVFAFGLPQHFQTLRQAGFAAMANADVDFVGGPRPLIMPLVFNWQDLSLEEGAIPGSDLQPDNLSGHNVVAFAERIYDPESPVNVQLTFLDSAEGNVPRDRIIQRGETIIRNSHWLGRPSSYPPKPVFGEPKFVHYPKQRNATACGLHVIFNAWVFVLGDLRNNKAFYPSESFYRQGVEVVNLAMAGCSNSQTIRAWLVSSRYALIIDGEVRECDQTVEMYDWTTLRDIWDERAAIEGGQEEQEERGEEEEEEEEKVIQKTLAEADDDREVQKAIEEAAKESGYE